MERKFHIKLYVLCISSILKVMFLHKKVSVFSFFLRGHHFTFELKQFIQVTVSLIILCHLYWEQNFLYWCGGEHVMSSLNYRNSLTFGQQMVTFSLPAIHGVSKHSFTQVTMWSKGPNDHLPLVSTTMGPVLPKACWGWLAFVLTRRWVRESFKGLKKPLPPHMHSHPHSL